MKAAALASEFPVGFTYHFDLEKDGVVVDSWVDSNVIPVQGLDYIANAIFGDVAAIGTFYVGVFSNNYIPTSASVAADFPVAMGEFVGYSETARPAWARINTSGVISNVVSRAAFTVTSPATLYGGVLVSSSVKGSTAGTLLSAARFSSAKTVEAGMVLRVRAEISFIPTSVV